MLPLLALSFAASGAPTAPEASSSPPLETATRRLGPEPCLGAFAVRFLPGGTKVLSLDEKLVLKVCDLRTGTLAWQHPLVLPRTRAYTDAADVQALVVSDDGSRVAILWRAAMIDDEAHLAVWAIDGGATSLWRAAVPMPDEDATWVPVWSPDGREIWAATTSGRAPLLRLDAATGAVLGQVPDVALGVLHEPDPFLAGEVALDHPLNLAPLRVAEVLWTAGAPAGRCDRVNRCTTAPVAGGSVSPRTGARTSTPAPGATELRTGTSTFSLAWSAATGAGGSGGRSAASESDGALLLTPRQGAPVRVPVCPAPQLGAPVRGSHLEVSVLASPDGERLAVSGCDAVTEVDTARGTVRTIRPPRSGATRVLAPPGGPLGLAWYPASAPGPRAGAASPPAGTASPPAGTASHAEIVVFDTATGAAVRTLDDPFSPVRFDEAAFSPDGRWLATQSGASLRVHHLADGARVEASASPGEVLRLLGWIDADRVLLRRGARAETGGLTTFSLRDRAWVELRPRRDDGTPITPTAVVLDDRGAGPPMILVSTADGVAGLDTTGLQRWHRPLVLTRSSSLVLDQTGEVVRVSHSPKEGAHVHLVAATGAPHEGTVTFPRLLDGPRAPRSTWGAWAGLGPDGVTLAELSWLGTVWTHRYDGVPPSVLDAGLARVRDGAVVRPEQVVGHWALEAAWFDTAEGTTPTDLAGFVGAGGYRFGADGTYGAGLLQLGQRWRLLDPHRLETTDVRGRVEVWALRVDGDVMEWALYEPPDGDFGVKAWLRLRRDAR